MPAKKVTKRKKSTRASKNRFGLSSRFSNKSSILFLILIPVVGIVTLITVNAAGQGVASVKDGDWNDPTVWASGKVPDRQTQAVIKNKVTCTAAEPEVGGVAIQPEGTLTYDPNSNCTILSNKNVIVQGLLTMQPANASLSHVLQFVGVDTSKFVGGGSVPLDSDVGLWVIDAGQLQAAGTPKTSWTTVATDIKKGQTAIRLKDSPTGWQVGDSVFISPTQPPTGGVGKDNYRGFDEGVIAATDGSSLTLDTPTTLPHPKVNNQWTAEVGNLTRNVKIEGTPTGYTHVFMHSTKPQVLNYTELRYVAPDPTNTNPRSDRSGRYAVHFHLSQEGSRGSTIIGTAVHDANNHVFVAHASNGITFKDDVSYNTQEDAFWWDPHNKDHTIPTFDTMVDHMLVAKVRPQKGSGGTRMAAYRMGFGDRNTMTNSVAVGVDAGNESSGYFWDDNEGASGVWKFQNNLSHNNHEQGLFVWQNTANNHKIENFTAYHNTGKGVDHGAYYNNFSYSNLVLFGNAQAGLLERAVAGDGKRQPSFTNVNIDGAGLSDYAIIDGGHNFDARSAVVMTNVTAKNYTKAAVYMKLTSQQKSPGWIDLVNSDLGAGNNFYFDDGLNSATIVRVLSTGKAARGLSYEVHPKDFAKGQLVPAWNARKLTK
ncbi:MAG: Fibronectin type domain protein [Candidatus Saccharibacteria bacterium]|nr:Fibronectin type domain protein [Candidatus Saccharibacteria bacterium]